MRHDDIPYHLKMSFDCGDHMWEISLEELYQAFKGRMICEAEDEISKDSEGASGLIW